jgi:integrase
MAIQVENNKEGTKSYTVYCDGADSRGKRVQLRRRGIKSLREAKAVEFELRRQIANKKDEAPCYTWDEWFAMCIERMKVELKPSTIIEYVGKNTHWIQPFFKGKFLKDITPQDVHEVVYNPEFDVTWYTRRGTLRRIGRIFQMAMEDGLISANPTLRIRVKVPDSRKAVLNRNEVDKLLLEAKKVEHRFYDVWVLAVMTGMRSGELYALKWDDICFKQNVIWVQRSWT